MPVRIIVTDANDNAPEFQGTPYFLNISEVRTITSVLRCMVHFNAVSVTGTRGSRAIRTVNFWSARHTPFLYFASKNSRNLRNDPHNDTKSCMRLRRITNIIFRPVISAVVARPLRDRKSLSHLETFSAWHINQNISSKLFFFCHHIHFSGCARGRINLFRGPGFIMASMCSDLAASLRAQSKKESKARLRILPSFCVSVCALQ